MNNEEQKTTELEEIATTMISEVADDVVTEESGKGGFGKVLLGLSVAAGVVGLVWHKTKDKREQRAIEKLRKKGYEIIEPEEVVEDDEIEAEYVEEEEFEPEKDEKKK